MGILLIMGTCVLVLFIGALRGKAEWLLNIVMRSVLGCIAIYFINGALETIGINLSVGVNPITVLTSGILGFPGLAALYGIGILEIL
ncbi:MAG: pro-sigmaK processing inhibitor BofA family protein [Lachnospiraceae bacterium]|nr:pro-sigmaK processing inhibitor BofA family protein [Lachnospiraceae bacterium]